MKYIIKESQIEKINSLIVKKYREGYGIDEILDITELDVKLILSALMNETIQSKENCKVLEPYVKLVHHGFVEMTREFEDNTKIQLSGSMYAIFAGYYYDLNKPETDNPIISVSSMINDNCLLELWFTKEKNYLNEITALIQPDVVISMKNLNTFKDLINFHNNKLMPTLKREFKRMSN